MHLRVLEVLAECDTPSWDGYGAYPVTDEAASTANYLLDSIPWLGGFPDIVPINDGAIELSFKAMDISCERGGGFSVYRYN